MHKVITLFSALALVVLVSSCEQCSTCTSVSDDPQTFDETLTDEVCGTGRDYDDQIEIYERSGWECTEN